MAPIGLGEQSIESIPEEVQKLDLLVKDTELAIINMFKQHYNGKKKKEKRRMISAQIENTNKEIEIVFYKE